MLKFDSIVFPGGKKKAVTFSFDDGTNQDKRLVNLFNQYGIKGTFNLNSGNLKSEKETGELFQKTADNHLNLDEIKQVYKNHEVAVHGYKHINLRSVPSNVQMYELIMDKANLEKLVGYPIIGAAYAFGTYNKETLEILKLLKISYGRTVNSHHDFELPDNPLEWNPTCHFNDEKMSELIEQFLYEKATGGNKPKLMYIWGHSYELDELDKWEYMDNLLQKLSGREDVWYASNGEIITYMHCFNQLTYSMNGNIIKNDTCRNIWININETVYQIRAGETIHVSL